MFLTTPEWVECPDKIEDCYCRKENSLKTSLNIASLRKLITRFHFQICPGRGRGRDTPRNFWWGVQLCSPNSDHISDQNRYNFLVPFFRPGFYKAFPFSSRLSDQNGLKPIISGATQTNIAYIEEYPTPTPAPRQK